MSNIHPILLVTRPYRRDLPGFFGPLISGKMAEPFSSRCDLMPNPTELSLFEKMLLATDGTVTDLISLFAGERVVVQKLEQTIHEGLAPLDLQCATPTRLLHRRILFSGKTRNFLYAESQFLLDRLPEAVRESMLHTDLPVGLSWKEARLETSAKYSGGQSDPGPRSRGTSTYRSPLTSYPAPTWSTTQAGRSA